MQTLAIETRGHGRCLVEEAADPTTRRLLVAFHGYGQNAEDILTEVRQIPGVSSWRIAAVQALHRFYARDHQKTVASWMTSEDRDLAIADNVDYVDRVLDLLAPAGTPGFNALVCVGFSQGAAMAYRAARLGRRRADGVIALGGDIPPELKRPAHDWPAVLIGAGAADQWYTAARLESDIAFLAASDIRHDIVRFPEGHEWTAEFRAAAGAWLDEFE